MKVFVKCTGIESLLKKNEGVVIFQSKDASVVLSVVVRGDNPFKKDREYELILTE